LSQVTGYTEIRSAIASATSSTAQGLSSGTTTSTTTLIIIIVVVLVVVAAMVAIGFGIYKKRHAIAKRLPGPAGVAARTVLGAAPASTKRQAAAALQHTMI
jgi:flagellar basal body-associated protein FliL